MQTVDAASLDIDDLRVRGIRALLPAACLIEDVDGEPAVFESVSVSRREIARVVRGDDQRMLAVAMGTHGDMIAADFTPISYIALIAVGSRSSHRA